MIAELPPVEVVDVAIPVVKPPRSTPRKPKLHGVSSRGAWEGRSHFHHRDSSQRERGRRRRHSSSSSSSSSERYSDHRSLLATLLHNGLDHARGPDRGDYDRTPRGSGMCRGRDREREPRSRSSSAQHASVGHGTRPRSVTGPPARRDEQLLSDEGGDAGAAGELLGEVRNILNSRDYTRKGARSSDKHNSTIGHWDQSDPVDLPEDVPPAVPVGREAGSRGRGGSRTGRRSVEQNRPSYWA